MPRCAVQTLALAAALGWPMAQQSARAQAGAAATAIHHGVVWVVNEKDNALSRLDAQTWADLGSVPTCNRPRHVQAVKQRLYVACSGSNQVDVIDAATGRSLGQLPAGNDPEIFDLSADGQRLYASSEDKGELVVVDVSTARIVQSVAGVGAEPEGVKVSADGKRVFVASEAGNHVAVVNLASGKLEQIIPAGRRTRRLALADAGRELWASNEMDGTLSVIDTEHLTVLATVTLPTEDSTGKPLPSKPLPSGICVSADGRTVYVGLGRANHVAVIDVASRKLRALVPAGSRIWGVGLNADGSVLMAAGSLSDDLTLIDTASLKVLRRVPVGHMPHAVAVTD